jgi:hypothetical protein
MSQRKEKYLRRTLEQYDGIARDVDHLNNRVPTIARDLEMVKDRQAALARQRTEDMARIYTDVDRAITQERRRRRRDHRAARRANLLAFLALIVAIAALLTIVIERAELAEEQKTAEIVKAAAPVCITIPEMAEIITMEHVLEVPLTAHEQLELFEAAPDFDIWYPLAIAMLDVETDFRNIAGDGGASIGYMQVNKNYHTELMEQVGASDLWEPRDNFRTGLAYLAQQIERFDPIHMALMAYNMGPTGASKVWEGGIYESQYSRDVIECAERWAEILGW